MRHARITALPASVLARWTVALTASFVALVHAGTVIPRGVALAFACGIAGEPPRSSRSSATTSAR